MGWTSISQQILKMFWVILFFLLNYNRFTNFDSDKNEPCAVGCIVYNESDDILYTGDESGSIIAYSFKQVLSSIDIEEPNSMK